MKLASPLTFSLGSKQALSLFSKEKEFPNRGDAMADGHGSYILRDEPVIINVGRRTLRIAVRNLGDRPVQVGSHYHFFEVNRDLEFDRALAFGMRLNVPAGTAVRFEPGDTREVELVEFGGNRRITGLNNLTNGSVRVPERAAEAVERATRRGFRTAKPNEGNDG